MGLRMTSGDARVPQALDFLESVQRVPVLLAMLVVIIKTCTLDDNTPLPTDLLSMYQTAIAASAQRSVDLPKQQKERLDQEIAQIEDTMASASPKGKETLAADLVDREQHAARLERTIADAAQDPVPMLTKLAVANIGRNVREFTSSHVDEVLASDAAQHALWTRLTSEGAVPLVTILENDSVLQGTRMGLFQFRCVAATTLTLAHAAVVAERPPRCHIASAGTSRSRTHWWLRTSL
jgi:Arc/MetJ-type ribon-helix-helix transcriptional regulator